MKNGIKPIIVIIVLIVIMGLFIKQSVYADNQEISSKGNFVFADGERAAIYADDIMYLQREIDKLFNEVSLRN